VLERDFGATKQSEILRAFFMRVAVASEIHLERIGRKLCLREPAGEALWLVGGCTRRGNRDDRDQNLLFRFLHLRTP